MNFWKKLPKPFFALAPMDGVTDTVFRQIVASVACPQRSRLRGGRGRPDVFFTEFVPVDALVSKASKKVIAKSLKYSQSEKPIVAQVWGSDPEKFTLSARIIKDLGFDGIDINMGCPQRDVVKKSACSALINNPKLAVEIIEATIKGAGNLPVSLKTRLGFKEIMTEAWINILLQTPISALTVHLRTVAEESKVPAHWDEIGKAVEIRNTLKSKALIIGNGDVKSLKEAREKCDKYGIDGVMIGRGIFENPYIFNEKVDITKVSSLEKLKLLLKHLKLFQKLRGESKHFGIMKKFVKCYVNNFDGSSKLREKLMATKTLDELIGETKSLTA